MTTETLIVSILCGLVGAGIGVCVSRLLRRLRTRHAQAAPTKFQVGDRVVLGRWKWRPKEDVRLVCIVTNPRDTSVPQSGSVGIKPDPTWPSQGFPVGQYIPPHTEDELTLLSEVEEWWASDSYARWLETERMRKGGR